MSSVHAVSPPSGAQHEIRHGSHRAIVTEVGATLRHYSVEDADIIDGFGVEEWSPSGRGQVLAPWPNRLDGGKYRFEGRDGRAALDEPELRNAIHGLVRWLPWRTASKSADGVELTCVLHPQPGYPWRLDLQVGYRLDGTGLTVSVPGAERLERPRALRDRFPPVPDGWHRDR
jgi:Galactose mutarotase and related enzymes